VEAVGRIVVGRKLKVVERIAVFILPVMQHRLQDVAIASFRNSGEKVTGDELQAISKLRLDPLAGMLNG